MSAVTPLHIEFNVEALVAVRRAAGLTRSEMARRAQLDPSQLWRIETGRATPREDTAIRLARAVGVPLDALFRAVA